MLLPVPLLQLLLHCGYYYYCYSELTHLASQVLPPVAAVRFEDVEFPFKFEVREKDVFAEAKGSLKAWSDVTVVARLDNDGVAATRDPYDLVGSTVLDQPSKPATLTLVPRGSAVKKILGRK